MSQPLKSRALSRYTLCVLCYCAGSVLAVQSLALGPASAQFAPDSHLHAVVLYTSHRLGSGGRAPVRHVACLELQPEDKALRRCCWFLRWVALGCSNPGDFLLVKRIPQPTKLAEKCYSSVVVPFVAGMCAPPPAWLQHFPGLVHSWRHRPRCWLCMQTRPITSNGQLCACVAHPLRQQRCPMRQLC